MTELSEGYRETALDDEGSRANRALRELQASVDDFLSRTGKSINDLTEVEQQELVDRIDIHLAFELHLSQDIYAGLPLIVSGSGGFMVADHEGSLLGAERTTGSDVITGMVSKVRAYPVPTLQTMLEPADSDEEISTRDLSLSAVVILEGATFYSSPIKNGLYEITHDLGDLQAIIPVIYRMETRVADIDS